MIFNKLSTVFVYDPVLSLKKKGFLHKKIYRQYYCAHYYCVHLDYLSDKAEVCLLEAYLVLCFENLQELGEQKIALF